jgi:tetratricopeptide (TPR) repeat protein
MPIYLFFDSQIIGGYIAEGLRKDSINLLITQCCGNDRHRPGSFTYAQIFLRQRVWKMSSVQQIILFIYFMEFPILIAFFAFIFYLRYVPDKRSESEKEEDRLSENIALYRSGDLSKAFETFDQRIKQYPQSSISYLYRGLCYKQMGNLTLAAKDFLTGISYDNTFANLYTELGKLQRETGQLADALNSFTTAIRVSRGEAPEPYHQRGLTLQLLGRSPEADIDFATEEFLEQQEAREKPNQTETNRPPWFDRKLLLNIMLVFVWSALLIVTIKTAASIHLPYLTAVVLSVALGFAEPDRGWILATTQCITLLVVYMYVMDRPASQARTELEYFMLFGAIGLTFMTSFLGAFLKKAINS